MLSLQIILKSVFGKWLNWIFIFVLPILLSIIICLVWNAVYIVDPQIIAPNVSSLSIISSSLCVVPPTIFAIRNSDIVRKIQSSKKSIIDLYITIAYFFAGLQFFSYFLLFGITTLILSNEPTVVNLWKTADWLQVMYSVVITILLSLSIAFVIGIFAKSHLFVTMFGLLCLIIALLLGFIIYPFQIVIALQMQWIFYLSYICPWHYTTTLLNESWLQTTAFNLTHTSIFDLWANFESAPMRLDVEVQRLIFICLTVTDQSLDMFMPWIMMTGCVVAIWLYMRNTRYSHSI